jgi:hypothetical protein
MKTQHTLAKLKISRTDLSLAGKSITELNTIERQKPGSTQNQGTTNLSQAHFEIQDDKHCIALIPFGDYDHTFAFYEQALANAKLFSAAPEMLEYLQQLLYDYEQSGIDKTKEKYNQLKELIKQATE